MHAHARFRLADGSDAILLPGDLIGRTWTAALRIDDPHISEAHAMLSLRGGSLVLLALRGRFLVDGAPVQDAELRTGQHIALSPETSLLVQSLALPDEALALEGPGLPQQVLTRTSSLTLGPPPSLRPGARADADAVLWWTGEGWRARIGLNEAFDLHPGDSLAVADLTFQAVGVPLSTAAADSTRAGVDAALTIVARFDTVHLLRDGQPPLVLTGQLARILSEVATVAVPIAWDALAGEIWPGSHARSILRRRWDTAMVRLRARLREGGVRPDLVRPSGNGLVEIVLDSADRVIDET